MLLLINWQECRCHCHCRSHCRCRCHGLLPGCRKSPGVQQHRGPHCSGEARNVLSFPSVLSCSCPSGPKFPNFSNFPSGLNLPDGPSFPSVPKFRNGLHLSGNLPSESPRESRPRESHRSVHQMQTGLACESPESENRRVF